MRAQAELLERAEAEARRALELERAQEQKLRQKLAELEAEAELCVTTKRTFEGNMPPPRTGQKKRPPRKQWNARRRESATAPLVRRFAAFGRRRGRSCARRSRQPGAGPAAGARLQLASARWAAPLELPRRRSRCRSKASAASLEPRYEAARLKQEAGDFAAAAEAGEGGARKNPRAGELDRHRFFARAPAGARRGERRRRATRS